MSKRRGYRSDRGQSLLEYAVVLPVLLLVIFGIIEFAMVLVSHEALTNAAREGARAGIVPYADPAQRQAAAISAAIDRAAPLTLTAANVQFTWETAAKTIRVEVSYDPSDDRDHHPCRRG